VRRFSRTTARVRSCSLGAVVYVLVGYPLLIGLLGRVRRKRRLVRSSAEPPSVSIVIAAFNEERTIASKLHNVFALDYPTERMEVIIAAQGSTDRTAEIASAISDRTIVLTGDERTGKLAAVEAACLKATGDIIVLSDANNMYRIDTLRNLMAPFADPRVGAVSGAKMTTVGPASLALGERAYWRYEKFIKQSEARFSSCTSASGEILAVRADLIEPLAPDAGLDDFERICGVLRKRHRVDFAADAVSLEPTSASQAGERQRRARITAQRWRLLARPHRFPLNRPVAMWQILSHKVGRLFLPLLAMVAFVSNCAEVATDGAHRRRFARVLLGGQVMFYVLAALGPRVPMPGRIGMIARIPRYLVVTNAATVEGLLLAVRDSRVLWDRVDRHENGG
jgi:biofilm PGA synthesis N-glycosyltransferase PgaC